MGVTMAYPHDLLAQAKHLTHLEKRRPKQASFRRAVSTAYYALFHFLILEAVSRWKVRGQRAALARTFEHARMKAAAIRFRRLTIGHSDREAAGRLQATVETFAELYEDRQLADYDLASRWSRTETKAWIEAVESAFANWPPIRSDIGPSGEFFCSVP